MLESISENIWDLRYKNCMGTFVLLKLRGIWNRVFEKLKSTLVTGTEKIDMPCVLVLPIKKKAI